MQKKSNTPRKTKSRAELRRKLARDLSAVLKNPALPVHIYNQLREEISSLATWVDYDEPGIIETSLIAFEANQETQKGGAR